MRHLFDDEKECWTEEAQNLAVEFDSLIRPFIAEAVARGVSARDLELIMSYGLSTTCIEVRMKDLNARKGK